ncbi:MAG: metal ABC transporter ATP-binding protein [Micrococcus sp.]|nr:metal ABC transporter ATP-binding protein [Micrococcus sp.]
MSPHTPAHPDGDAPVLARATGLELRHGDHLAVAASDLSLPAGGVVAVIGPNGSGKSTLLKALAGVLAPSAGTVEVLGAPARQSARRIAFVMQSVHAPDGTPLTVRDVVRMGRYATRGWFRPLGAQDRRRVQEAMDRMDIADLAGRHLGELSGGQRQRVYVAQGLAQDHDVLMLDEPLTGLDLVSAHRIDELIHEEPARGVSVVFTTHDLDEAHAADHVVLMGGRVVASGTPARVLTRENLERVYGIGSLHAPRGAYWDEPHHHEA